MLLQACIATASLGSSSTETLVVNHAVVKDGHAVTASITAFNWWILNARCQWTATSMAASNNLLFESVGIDIATLLLEDVIAAMSLANTEAAITLAVIDVSTSTQRMVLNVTCHSAVTVVALCLPSMATSHCCCGVDTNALLCTCDPPMTTVGLECASEHDVLWLQAACTVASGTYQCHNCTTQQITSASTEACTRWLPRQNYASAGVSSHYVMTDPVSAAEPLTVLFPWGA